jgi:hypothetical protein
MKVIIMAVTYINDSARDMLMKMDGFNVPMEVTGPDAWIHNILDILFLEKGTYSDTPELGIDLNSITYLTTDEMVRYISDQLTAQTQKYLPDVPLSNLTVSIKETENSDYVLNISVAFSVNYGTVSRSAFVSVKNKIIDYIVEKFDMT